MLPTNLADPSGREKTLTFGERQTSDVCTIEDEVQCMHKATAVPIVPLFRSSEVWKEKVID